MIRLPQTRSCFVCGRLNPLGLKLQMETDGALVQARFEPRPEHVGFKDTIHGGILSTLLDELMVWACAVRTRKFAYCAELTVRFQRPVAPGACLLATGHLVQNRRDRIFETAAEAKDEAGLLVVSATGKYMPIKDETLPEMFSDFLEELDGNFWASLHAQGPNGALPAS